MVYGVPKKGGGACAQESAKPLISPDKLQEAVYLPQVSQNALGHRDQDCLSPTGYKSVSRDDLP